MYKIMTPGPTSVPASVMRARSLWFPNSDTDADFIEEYHSLCRSIAELLHTENEVYIMNGEGILGLEAACASLTEPNDRVLVLDNGIYGRGFLDFVKMYGGIPVLYTSDYRKPIDVKELRKFLEKDHDFKYATVVHCDTPSGMLNDVSAICPLLKSYGILTVADSVSAMFGAELRVDDWQIDIACGGSQKALSAPSGLTLISVSPDAFNAIERRKAPIASFYCSIAAFRNYYEDKWFPYTMPASDIYGLKEAVRIAREDCGRLERHSRIAAAVRRALTEGGLTLYADGGYSPTVTVFNVPDGIRADNVINIMRAKYKILIAGSLDILSGKVLRIGHMGNNANVCDMSGTLEALENALKCLGFEAQRSLKAVFGECLSDMP
ncbi:MAG: alanine--glyoxylate aminotransferase family protein [Butyrivibrio sp.]|nr:alanine--glyoxylate aminotransferase family protein [Butyrivibrio sp.]